MTLTGASAADFSDGITEAAVEKDTFTDGSEGIETESITAMVNDMAAHAQEKGQEYQDVYKRQLVTMATRSLGPVPASDLITMVMPRARMIHPATRTMIRTAMGRELLI